MAPRTSANFCSSDADTAVFESSDEVRFYIHRKNLETHTYAFPSEVYIRSNDGNDPAKLTEDSTTLEHLFIHLYPQPHPNFDLIPPKEFFLLAEAAEKYQFPTLMSLCHQKMKELAQDHPLHAFQYGSKHQYNDILDLAAPLVMDLPTEKVCEEIPDTHHFAWLKYEIHWRRAIDIALKKYSKFQTILCAQCRSEYATGSVNVRVTQPSSPQSLRAYLRQCYPSLHYEDSCTDCGCHAIIYDHDPRWDDSDPIVCPSEPFPYEEALHDLDCALIYRYVSRHTVTHAKDSELEFGRLVGSREKLTSKLQRLFQLKRLNPVRHDRLKLIEAMTPPRISKNFGEVGADTVSFESSDGVHFYIHQRNLETHSDVFPPGVYNQSNYSRDPAKLTEDSTTLEHLFTHMYPRDHPNFDMIPPKEFFLLAEAAQKYQMPTLMALCYQKMKQRITEEYPLEAFQFSCKHHKDDIVNVAAPLLMDLPIDEVFEAIPATHQLAWIKYAGHYRRTIAKLHLIHFQNASAFYAPGARSSLPLVHCYPDITSYSCYYCNSGPDTLGPGDAIDYGLNSLVFSPFDAFPSIKAAADLEQALVDIPEFTTYL
ncbi:hypothetical protein H0H93_005203 [Arthromyces matolae]|nr:hypothetical protein H0H93_005203 [Arthromyces matolae]